MNPLDVPTISLLLSAREFAACLSAIKTVLAQCEQDYVSQTLGDPSGEAMTALRSLHARLETIYRHRTGPSERH